MYAELDYGINTEDKKNVKVDFSFLGNDEGRDEVFGRGWAKINRQELQGYFCFHDGDDSHFKAKLKKKGPRKQR